MKALFNLLGRTPGFRGDLVTLLLVMALAALTEGLGLFLLVPILATLDGATGGTRLIELPGNPGLGAMLALFVAVVALRGAILLWRGLLVQRFQSAVVDTLRKRIWRALAYCDWRHLMALRQAHNLSLLVTELERVGTAMQMNLAAAAALVTLAVLAAVALWLAPALALAGLAATGLLYLAHRRQRRIATRLGEQLGQAYANVQSGFGEGLASLRVTKALGAEARAEARAFAAVDVVAENRRAFVIELGRGQVLLQAGAAAIIAVAIWLATAWWNMALSTIIPLAALFVRAVPLLATVMEAAQNWAHSRPALDTALALIDQAEAAREPELPDCAAPRAAATIALDRVDLHYAGQAQPALSGVSLTLPVGTITALTGPSGAGKSTLADVAAGLLSPDRGHLSIDGAHLDGAMRRAWRGAVAHVEQDPVLLSSSVRDNLSWSAPQASEAQLWTALEDAALADFIRTLPQGLDTPLGDGGRRLSGGERQRLMLARALLRDPQLLILDEATSALDPANEAAVAGVVRSLRGRLTVLLICHRGALLDLADQVVRIDRGQVVDES